MEIEANISVIYLFYVPYGSEHLVVFLDSYKKFAAGVDHRLVIAIKGIQGISETNSIKRILADNQIEAAFITVENKGLDIDSYYSIMNKLKTEFVFLLNTKSIIKFDNWLLKYFEGFNQNNVGAISATASFQSHYSSVYTTHSWKPEFKKGFQHNFRKYKLFIKAFLIWRWYFKPFPNPHLRTNAMMIRRDIFLSLKHKPADNKFKAYEFESGRNSLTNQLLKKGLHPLVIDKNGKLFELKDWYNSFTFRRGIQQNLLIADNQTNIYDEADQKEKRKLTFLAWGKYE